MHQEPLVPAARLLPNRTSRPRGNAVGLPGPGSSTHLSHSFVHDIPPAIPLPCTPPPRAEWTGQVNFEALFWWWGKKGTNRSHERGRGS